MLSPSLALAGPVLETARSVGEPAIDPATVAELLVLLESAVVLLTDAVSEKSAPAARLVGAKTTRLKVSELPVARAAVAVWVTVPLDWPKVKTSVPEVFV